MKKSLHLAQALLLCTLLFINFACGSDHSSEQQDNQKDQEILKKAATIHNEAINIGMQVAPRLEVMRQMSNQINIQGKALSELELQFTSRVDRITNSHRYWLEHLIEVPGFGHDHDHGHHDHSGHDHAHHDHSGSQPELSADQMLAAQQEIKDSIVMIKQQLEQLQTLVQEL